jgi:hypothetical protein
MCSWTRTISRTRVNSPVGDRLTCVRIATRSLARARELDDLGRRFAARRAVTYEGEATVTHGDPRAA